MQETQSCNCTTVIWDRKLLTSRAVVVRDRKLLESRVAFSGLLFVEPFKKLFATDATTNWNEETVSLLKDLFDLLPRDKALLILLGVFGLQKPVILKQMHCNCLNERIQSTQEMQ